MHYWVNPRTGVQLDRPETIAGNERLPKLTGVSWHPRETLTERLRANGNCGSLAVTTEYGVEMYCMTRDGCPVHQTA